jgi:Ca2+-binding EF-hand superfamily protein
VQGIGKLFQIADENGDGKIELQTELARLITDLGVILNKTELVELIRLLDLDHTGQITYTQFLRKVAPPLTSDRLVWINRAFDKLDVNGTGRVSISHIKSVHNPASTEMVRIGRTDANEILVNLLESYDSDGDGEVTRDEFMDYYREVSPLIRGEDFFERWMKHAWGLF